VEEVGAAKLFGTASFVEVLARDVVHDCPIAHWSVQAVAVVVVTNVGGDAPAGVTAT
jgi:hypothetical protein